MDGSQKPFRKDNDFNGFGRLFGICKKTALTINEGKTLKPTTFPAFGLKLRLKKESRL